MQWLVVFSTNIMVVNLFAKPATSSESLIKKQTGSVEASMLEASMLDILPFWPYIKRQMVRLANL
jgi:hypothetical protein